MYMNKADLINEVSHKTKLTKKEIDTILSSILDTIVAKVSEGERVRLVGFGSFYKSPRKFALHSVEDSNVSERSIAKFSPGKFFKQKINVQN
jgi:DNA-binding protein HU-beta